MEDWGASLVEDHQGAVAVSALRNEGLEVMMRRLADRMRAITQVTELMVPYDRGDILASIHREGEVVMSELEDGGMRIRARLSSASANASIAASSTGRPLHAERTPNVTFARSNGSGEPERFITSNGASSKRS